MIRLSVIGAGHWGPNLIRNFHNGQTSKVRTVVDRDRERLEQVRSRFADVRVTEDVEAVFGDPDADAVVIATPTATHYSLVKRALEVRKHVLVEKPITNSSREAEELLQLAEKNRCLLMVGHVFLFNGAVRKVKEYLEKGELGRIYYISMVRTNLGPIRTDVNANWDLASHDVSIVNYWLGSSPVTVSSVGGSWINRSIEDAVFTTLRYPHDVLVNLHTSWLNPRKSRDITVVGERRMLTFDDMNLLEPIRIFDKQVTETRKPDFADTFASFRQSVREGDIVIPRVTAGEPLKNECDHFLECIREKKQPLTDGKLGLSVVRALEAMERSMRSNGREEKV